MVSLKTKIFPSRLHNGIRMCGAQRGEDQGGKSQKMVYVNKDGIKIKKNAV